MIDQTLAEAGEKMEKAVAVAKEDFSTLRASTGVGVSWTSPLGPLRFAFAVPVRKFPGDRIQKLQFQIGSSF